MPQPSISRRQLLKIVAAAAGTAVLSSVPNKWETPVVDVGMLPAHAQSLSGNGAIEGSIILNYVPAPGMPTGTNSPAVRLLHVQTISPLAINGVVGKPVFLASAEVYPYMISNVPTGNYTVRANASGCGGSPYEDKTGVGVTAPATTLGINFSFFDCGA